MWQALSSTLKSRLGTGNAESTAVTPRLTENMSQEGRSYTGIQRRVQANSVGIWKEIPRRKQKKSHEIYFSL